MNTIRYIVLVDLQLLSELTEKLPGKCDYPSPHTSESVSRSVIYKIARGWMVSLAPTQCQGKDQENDTKVKTLCPLEQLEGEP